VNGSWVARLDSVSTTGATNVNATSGIMTNGAGTFSIPTSTPQTFQLLSFVTSSGQLVQAGALQQFFPLDGVRGQSTL